MFAAIVDDLEMKPVPGGLGKELFQVPFGVDDACSACQPPPLSQSMNVSVDWEGILPECLAHYHTRRFMTNSRQFFKLFKTVRDLPVVNFD